ncbi:hypothetical protein MCCC1A01412_28250 [Bacillus anthracis]|uniref:type II toxin-antitoxin system PemK/MazF family toxin n=1 Tax=Bacillus anthracis TaxID=1392 RepID=UPI0008FDBDB3|nr:type II toxin-antitoxin system PemK/MazF family toxin [Bacillus anthracis]OJD97286.1 hypothetical protein MCCC1A01412_28250 [Bacillus anthracis]
MRYSDVQVGNIYFAKLDPVRQYEFGGNHLCIVLRKCNDHRSVAIISLTSNSSGVGENKVDLGLIPELPERLRTKQNGKPVHSYAILNQIRTIVTSRIEPVVDGKDSYGNNIEVDCPLSPFAFHDLVHKLSDISIADLQDESAIAEYHKKAFFNYCVRRMVDLTYGIDRQQGDMTVNQKEVKYLHRNALAIEENFSIKNYLNSTDLANNVDKKINDIILIPSN